MSRCTDEYGDPYYGVRLKYAAHQNNGMLNTPLPSSRSDLENQVANLRINGGVVLSSLAADLIEQALNLKDAQ